MSHRLSLPLSRSATAHPWFSLTFVQVAGVSLSEVLMVAIVHAIRNQIILSVSTSIGSAENVKVWSTLYFTFLVLYIDETLAEGLC